MRFSCPAALQAVSIAAPVLGYPCFSYLRVCVVQVRELRVRVHVTRLHHRKALIGQNPSAFARLALPGQEHGPVGNIAVGRRCVAVRAGVSFELVIDQAEEIIRVVRVPRLLQVSTRYFGVS